MSFDSREEEAKVGAGLVAVMCADGVEGGLVGDESQSALGDAGHRRGEMRLLTIGVPGVAEM